MMRDDIASGISALCLAADRCDDAVTHFIDHHGRGSRVNAFTTVATDSAELFRFTARLLIRESAIATALCVACIDAAARCIVASAHHEGKAYEACSAGCRRCIDACDRIAKAPYRDEGVFAGGAAP